MKTKPVFVYKGRALAQYNFGENHPFGPQRHDAFHNELEKMSFDGNIQTQPPESADAVSYTHLTLPTIYSV